MIYVTGDTHGDAHKLFPENLGCLTNLKSKEDVLIICGDFSFIFGTSPKEIQKENDLLDELETTLQFSIAFCDGNHCNFNRLNSYPIEEWNGGKVHKIRAHIIHLLRGQVYEIPYENSDKKARIYAMGGGYSYDCYRRRPNIDWWPYQELPSQNEYDEAYKNLQKAKNEGGVDVLISHVPRIRVFNVLSIMNDRLTPNPEEAQLMSFIETAYNELKPKCSFSGHLHIDENRIPACPGSISVLNEFYDALTGEKVSKLDY